MTHTINLTTETPVIHVKAYGGIKISGSDQSEVQCRIDAPQLATLVEENGHVYITANASCDLTIPVSSSIELERGMGSVSINNVNGKINIEKVLGNLVLSDVGPTRIEKVGGNFSIRNVDGDVSIEKVGATVVVENVGSFHCEKAGGSCYVKDVRGDFQLLKIGGKFLGQRISGKTQVEKVGGSFNAGHLNLTDDLKAGGSIHLSGFEFDDQINMKAGGSIDLELGDELKDGVFDLKSGAFEIRIKLGDDDLKIHDGIYTYNLGEGGPNLSGAAGGAISLRHISEPEVDLVGDLSKHFTHEESVFSELIQEQVESATRLAEAKIRAAELRLEQIRDQVDKHRGFNIDIDPDIHIQTSPQSPPVPPVNRPVGKKGASDEERLMILKMLEDKLITVDEAETLFKALDD